jgi:PIN domain nuclease of toxin-antitoxin system
VSTASPNKPLLLDTHTLLWWLLDAPELSAVARAAIARGGQRVFVSAASSWELAIKYRLGKLPSAADIVENLPRYLRKERFDVLPIGLDHTLAAGALPDMHRDPFDRMLIAQAQINKLQLVSRDAVFADYGVDVLW